MAEGFIELVLLEPSINVLVTVLLLFVCLCVVGGVGLMFVLFGCLWYVVYFYFVAYPTYRGVNVEE